MLIKEIAEQISSMEDEAILELLDSLKPLDYKRLKRLIIPKRREP